MSFFDDNFPGVRDMIERESARKAEHRADKPWCVMGLEFGRPIVESSWDTRDEAEQALAKIFTTCAPFIRDSFRIEHRP